MTKFERIIRSPVVITEGAVIERLRRDTVNRLDPWIENSGLIYTAEGRSSLEVLYREYLDIGQGANLPLLLFTPTWRANPERILQAGLSGRKVNTDATRFLLDLLADYRGYADNVLLGGLIGCRGDAYQPGDALSSHAGHEFHRAQVEELAGAGVDFLFAATLPAASEAEGIARAMAQTGVPYALSFVVTGNATLLDGTPLAAVIDAIDSEVVPQPSFYMANCVHPEVFRKCASRMSMESPAATRRVIGLQANTSPRSPAELDGSQVLHDEDPDRLAEAMVRLRIDFGLRILGGCCGTDGRHIARMAERLSRLGSAIV